MMAMMCPRILCPLLATKGKPGLGPQMLSDWWWGHGSLGQQQAVACCHHSQKLLRSPRKPTRKISKIPFKVLDAPELQDDFYLNLVDWSSLNVLSVGLGTCVYLWSACTSQVSTKARRGALTDHSQCNTAELFRVIPQRERYRGLRRTRTICPSL